MRGRHPSKIAGKCLRLKSSPAVAFPSKHADVTSMYVEPTLTCVILLSD